MVLFQEEPSLLVREDRGPSLEWPWSIPSGIVGLEELSDAAALPETEQGGIIETVVERLVGVQILRGAIWLGVVFSCRHGCF
jgi:hypothetical protein